MTMHHDIPGHDVNQPPPSDNAAWLRSNNRAARLGARLGHAGSLPAADAGSRTHSRSLGLMSPIALLLDLDDPAQNQFGDYRLTALLGQGGMGVVYRAHQTRLERDIALKLLIAGPWAAPDVVERLRHEARHAARLAHPNIVSVFDVDEHDGIVFFTMRLVEGRSLRDRLADPDPITTADAVRLIRRVAEALDYAHRMGVLHLDIKPSNILLDEPGEPHLADFGLARHLAPDPHDITHEASGTPHYMAPEQVEPSLHPLSAATDIHALGATLFEMLAGRVPIAGATPRETMQRIVAEDAPRLRTLQPTADRDLEAICARCLARDPRQRYASAAALADDLRRWQHQYPVHARGGGAPYRAGRFIRRNRTAVALATLIALSLIGGASGVIWQQGQAQREAAQAMAMRDYAIDMLRQSTPGQGAPEDLLANGAGRLDLLPRDSIARLELLVALLQRHEELEWHQAGRELARRELGDSPSLGASPHPIRLLALAGWAQAHAAVGEPSMAIAVLEPAVASSTLAHTSIHAQATNLLGQIHTDAGQHVQAERWHRHALAQYEQSAVPEHPDLARTRILLAATLAAQRHDAQALALTEQAATSMAPEDSPQRAEVLHHAGIHHMLAGDAKRARLLFAESRLLHHVLGNTRHIGSRTAIHAANALDLGEPALALVLLDEATEILAATGRRHSLELANLNRMRGEIALAGGDANLAAAALGEAVDLYMESGFRAEIVYTGALLASTLIQARRVSEARATLQRTAPPPDTNLPPAANAMRAAAIAWLAHAAANTTEAKPHFEQALGYLDPATAEPSPLVFRLREARDLQRIRAWHADASSTAAGLTPESR